MALRARKVSGAFEKRPPGLKVARNSFQHLYFDGSLQPLLVVDDVAFKPHYCIGTGIGIEV